MNEVLRATPRAFISYSHDDAAHQKRVLSLSTRLRRDGVDAFVDQYVNGTPDEGWPRWMLNRLDWADHVVVVCTETYYLRFRGKETSNAGKGVNWEGSLILRELYDKKSMTSKFVPVLFASGDSDFVPEPLRVHTRYLVSSRSGYHALRSFLLDQAGVQPVPIGVLEILGEGRYSNEAPGKSDVGAMVDVYRALLLRLAAGQRRIANVLLAFGSVTLAVGVLGALASVAFVDAESKWTLVAMCAAIAGISILPWRAWDARQDRALACTSLCDVLATIPREGPLAGGHVRALEQCTDFLGRTVWGTTRGAG